LPDAKGAKVAQKTQKRKSKKQKCGMKSKRPWSKGEAIFKPSLVFFASFAQLLRPLRPAIELALKWL
jgi:hypothetical protein